MRALLPFLRLYKKQWVPLGVGILLAMLAVLCGLGLLAVAGWFITATAVAGMVPAAARAFDFFTPGAAVRGFSIGRIFTRYLELLISHDATFKLLAQLRLTFFDKLTKVPHTLRSSFRSGDLLSRMVSDIDALDRLYLRLFTPLLSVIAAVLVIALVLEWLCPPAGKVAGSLLGGALVLLPPLFYWLGKRLSRLLGERLNQLRQTTVDALQAIAEQTVYDRNGWLCGRVQQAAGALERIQFKLACIEALGLFLVTLVVGVTALSVLSASAEQWRLGNVTAPVMVMTLFTVMAVTEAFSQLPAAFQFLGHTERSASRLSEVLSAKPLRYGSGKSAGSQCGSVSLRQLRFSYDRNIREEGPIAGRHILDGIDLDVRSGEQLMLMGETGCGKSTLLRILTRQLVDYEGTVELGGLALEQHSADSIAQSVVLVPQVTDLFSATLRDNLKIASTEATDDQLMEVVYAVGLDRLAASDRPAAEQSGSTGLLDIWLGAGGVALSGGEQRRLAVARAALRDADLLLLDEAGEGLDEDSERALTLWLLKRFKEKTIIAVSHRETLAPHLDRVLILENGKIT